MSEANLPRALRLDEREWPRGLDHHPSAFQRYARCLPGRVLAHLQLLDGDFGRFPIDRLHHSLQTATRAHRAGESEVYS